MVRSLQSDQTSLCPTRERKSVCLSFSSYHILKLDSDVNFAQVDVDQAKVDLTTLLFRYLIHLIGRCSSLRNYCYADLSLLPRWV